jgi:hypothetical protein
MYAAWSFIMFLITLSISLISELNLTKENTHLVIIVLMLIKLIAYFLIENFALYKYCKFIFTPWLVYGLFLADLILNPGFNDHQSVVYMPSNNSLWSYHVSKIISLLNLNYLLEICLAAIYLFLFICKVVKFIWNELVFQKIYLNNF